MATDSKDFYQLLLALKRMRHGLRELQLLLPFVDDGKNYDQISLLGFDKACLSVLSPEA